MFRIFKKKVKKDHRTIPENWSEIMDKNVAREVGVFLVEKGMIEEGVDFLRKSNKTL